MIVPLSILLASLILALGFIMFRRWETARGVRMFDARRTALDQYAEELWSALVLGGLPVRWRQNAIAVTHRLGHGGVHMAVSALRAAERPLARLSYKMRVSAPKAGSAQVSKFLQTITPQKGSGDFQEKSV